MAAVHGVLAVALGDGGRDDGFHAVALEVGLETPRLRGVPRGGRVFSGQDDGEGVGRADVGQVPDLGEQIGQRGQPVPSVGVRLALGIGVVNGQSAGVRRRGGRRFSGSCGSGRCGPCGDGVDDPADDPAACDVVAEEFARLVDDQGFERVALGLDLDRLGVAVLPGLRVGRLVQGASADRRSGGRAWSEPRRSRPRPVPRRRRAGPRLGGLGPR